MFGIEHSPYSFDCSQVFNHRVKNSLISPLSRNDTRDE